MTRLKFPILVHKSLLSFILFLFFQCIYAQTQFIERTVIDQSSSVIVPKDVLTIDIDGDGDQDMVTASYEDHKIAWYENVNGQGTYGPQKVISINAINAISVFAIDVDGDGDNDVLSASEGNNTIAWYENQNGLGSFSEAKVISSQVLSAKVVMALDLDNDGDIDVVSASSEDGKIAWYDNLDGNGNFGTEQLISSSALGVNSIDISDIDGDGYVDILSTSYFPAEIIDGEFIYRVNVEWHKHLDGQGNFGDTILIEKLSFDIPYQGKTADIDNDGDQDIVVGTRDKFIWYENTDGIGTFSESITIVNTRVIPFQLTDFNKDGILDIVVFNTSSDKLGWYQGKVNGGFTFKEIADLGYQEPEMVNVGDINNDGHPDVLLASSALQNVISFKYQPTTNDFGAKKDVGRNAILVREALLGDVDGDGDLDIVSASGFNKIAWYENTNNQGTFGLQKLITAELQGLRSIDLKDMDGDGDLDVMSVGKRYSGTISPLGWYENIDGLGTFNQEAHLVSLQGDSQFVFGADLDNDNDIDIITTEHRSSIGHDEILWHENIDGHGNFVDIGAWDAYDKSIANSHSTWDCQPADIDGDGDIDILYNSFLEEKIAWRENTDGAGTFANEHFIHATKRTYSIVPQDVDGDGDLDVIATSEIIAGKDRIEWYENTDGLGSFGEPILISDRLRNPRDITSSDLDGDGDNDLIVVDHADNIVGWFENIVGTGNFTNLYELTDGAEGAIHVTTGDINGDNKIDILTSSERDGSILWFQNVGPLNTNDPDGDGVLSVQEVTDNTDPDDGCSYLETSQDVNIVSIIWQEEDCDNDGVLNGVELTNGSNPRNQDTDGDGVLDGVDTNPVAPCIPIQNSDYVDYDASSLAWQSFDCDGDEILNGDELTAGTNPYFNEAIYTDSSYPDTFNEQQIETNGSARSIATNGITVAVGRRWGSINKVEIYIKNTDGIWGKTQEIQPPNTQGAARFGWTLAMNENTLFVAQPFGIQNQPDTIFIYQKDSNGIWVEVQQIQASSDFMEDGFGTSMDVSENTIVIGADGIAPAGAVYVFERNGNNTWVETAEIYPSDELFEGAIGHAVAIAADQIVVGASGYGEHGAFVYQRQIDNSWLEIQQLSAPDNQNYTFARDVSIADNRLIIGDIDYSDWPENYNKGRTIIYEKSYGGLWRQEQTLHAVNGYVGDYFGDALAMNDNRIVVNLSADQTDVGSLHIFHKSAGAWVETHSLTDPLSFSWNFGTNVAMAPRLIVTTSDEYVHFFEDSSLVVNLSITAPISCSGSSDASIEANAIGGSGAYTYELFQANDNSLITSGSSATFENLSTGSYYIVVTDSESNQAESNQIVISELEPLTVTISVVNIVCHGSNDGRIVLEAQGGSGQYEYSIDNGATFHSSNTFENLATGTYIAAVRDSNGCQIDMVFVIDEGINIEPEINVTEASCDNNDGSITITIANPGEYLFSIEENADISDFSLSNTFNQLESGTYTVSIAHISGCTKEQTVIIESATCPDFNLPTNNFTIETTGESCASSNNGSILLRAEENLDYTATLIGGIANETKEFRTFTNFNDLEAGSYELCITVAGEDGYNKCFTITITEPGELGVDSNLDESGKSISLSLTGGTRYYIDLNGTEYSTSEDHITIPLSKKENNITVKTDKECQGVYENTVMANYNSVSIYPNPVEKGDVSIVLPDDNSKEVLLTVFSENGIRVLEKMEKPVNKTVQINMDGMTSGVYTIIITTASQNSMRKIIKK